jgi:hypothetical protein
VASLPGLRASVARRSSWSTAVHAEVRRGSDEADVDAPVGAQERGMTTRHDVLSPPRPAPPRHPDHHGSDGPADLYVAAVLLVILIVLLAIKHPEPMPQRVFAEPSPQRFAIVRGGLEIARYDAKENTLTVDPKARRDLLVCLRGDCRLVEAWLGK